MKKLLLSILIVLILANLASAARDLPSYERFGISIDSHSEWTNSLIALRPGEDVSLVIEQRIKYSSISELTGPAGIEEKAPATWPCPGEAKYALVGKLGEDGQCFVIGNMINFVPKEENFFYFAINDDDYKDNSGKFQALLEINRPTCGDNVCSDSEIGFCKLDCEWCGDGMCGEKEACNACSEDCGFCQEDVEALEDVAEKFLNYRSQEDYSSILAITKDPVKNIFQTYQNFMQSFEEKSSFATEEKVNELLPKKNYGIPSLTIEDIEEDEATLLASTEEGEIKLQFLKSGRWFVKDSYENGEWLSEVDLDNFQQEQEEYLENVTQEIFEENAVSQTGFQLRTVLIILVTIVVFFGLIIGAIALRHKLPKIKFKKKKKVIEPEPVAETKETKKCDNCGSVINVSDAFCTTCGARNRKKR